MKVLLLLAGRSTRFWPLYEKPLFPICGKTLLEHQVERLQAADLTDILLIGGAHNLVEIEGLYPDLTRVEQEDLELGMRGAVLSALPHCGDEPVMVVSGNDVFETKAYTDLQESIDGDTAGALLAQKVDQYFPGGYLELDGDRITRIVEKPGEGNEPSDLVNIVAHVHTQPAALLEALQEVDESTDDGYEQALQKLFADHTYRAVSYDGVWQAVKYPWHLLQLLPIFLDELKPSIHPTAQVHPSAVVEGNVVLEEGVRVMPHASVIGPCYIGKNTIVANNALARGSSIGNDCVVGYSTEVKGSVWHSHVWTHMNYVGDSVIGRNVSFGAGTVTGNLRLDEAPVTSVVKDEKVDTQLVKFGAVIGNDCRIGTQVGTSPGVKIGQGTFIASNCAITTDVPEKQFLRMKDGQLVASDNTTSAPTIEEREAFKKQAGL